MTERRCEDCVWWKHYDNGRIHTRVGLCKRMPPTAIPFENPHREDDMANRGRPLWPIMAEYQWCGEFTPNAESE
jgi:hypothetical protein